MHYTIPRLTTATSWSDYIPGNSFVNINMNVHYFRSASVLEVSSANDNVSIPCHSGSRSICVFSPALRLRHWALSPVWPLLKDRKWEYYEMRGGLRPGPDCRLDWKPPTVTPATRRKRVHSSVVLIVHYQSNRMSRRVSVFSSSWQQPFYLANIYTPNTVRCKVCGLCSRV